MAANIILILLSVFFRYVLGHALVWSEELAKFILVWTVFLGASNAIRRWENLRVTFILDKLHLNASRVFDMVLKAVASGFIAFLFILALKSIPNVWSREMAPALGINMVIPELGIIVGLALMVLQCIGLIISFFMRSNL